MDGETQVVYEFGSFRLDPGQRTLMCKGDLVDLAPKPFDTLLFLVQNSGRVIEKDEFMKALWPDTFVEESSLTQNIFVVRQTLGDKNRSSFIKNISGRGYKFVASVRLLDIPTRATSSLPAEYWRRHSPFRSLQVFEQEDAWLFFGRNSETEELLLRLSRSPVLVVTGNSGCGKSSLVRAGLIPALREDWLGHGDEPSDSSPLPHPTSTRIEGSDSSTLLLARKTRVDAIDSWGVAIIRPSASPFDYLAEVLPSQLAPELDLGKQAEFIANCRNKLPLGGETLRDAIAALANGTRQDSGETRILLVVDQFEELFTLTADRQIRERYIDVLLTAGQREGSVPVHLILILRADFYSHCLEHPGLSRCLESNLYNVPRMTHEQLRHSIKERLELAGAHAESGLIDSLLDDVGTEPGNLALLEHALGRLWEKCGGFGRTLTNGAYSAMGRLRGALSAHADEVYNEITDDTQKHLIQKIFLELVNLGEGAPDTRRRVRKDDLLSLGAPEEIEPLLARLTASRLISMGAEGQETFAEVSHEALIREWSTLRDWVTQNRDELRLGRRLLQAAEEWNSLNCDAGALLQGARLALGEEWLTRHPAAPMLVRKFVQASITSRVVSEERELRKQKAAATRLRGLAIALAVALLAAIFAAWIAYRQQYVERSHALAAQSSNLLARDHGQALDLAIRGWRAAKTEETHLAVARAFPELLATLNHGSPVVRALFSPDGKRIASAGGGNGARLWDADGRLLATLQRGTEEIEDVAFSPDGERLATVSSDQRARIWNSGDGHLLATIGISQPKPVAFEASLAGRVAFSPDGARIATTGWDNTAKVWSAEDGHLLATLKGHNGLVVDVAFSPNGKHITTASWDHTARIWSSDGKLESELVGHTQIVYHAEFSPDSQQIITTSEDRTARIWKSADGRLLAVLPHDGIVTDGNFSPNGTQIVTVSYDHKARLWSSADGRLLFTLQHDGPLSSVQFSSDGRYIVTSSNDHTARIWNTADGRLLALLEGHNDAVNDAGFSPDGQHVVTGSSDGTLRIWGTATGLIEASLRGHRGQVTHAEFSPDGKEVVTNSSDGTARVWNVPDSSLHTIIQGVDSAFAHFSPDGQKILTLSADRRLAEVSEPVGGKLLTTLPGHSLRIWNAAFAPDGLRIITASADKTARVWNSTDGRLLLTLQGHTGDVYYGAFSPDGTRIVTVSADATAKLWNSRNGQVTATLQGHLDKIWSAAFSPDGQYVATASFDHTARLWSSFDGRLLAILEHADVVGSVQFSPDGRYIATASWDHTARVWSATDGRLITTLQGHTGELFSVAFSPDSRYIVTASSDHTAKVWTVSNFALLATLHGHGDQIWEAAFSPDSRHIVTASRDQTARIWRVLTLSDLESILAE
jgi:WD40 repeat protein/DNA-binding winged helix-turn-helix (wHTH) protein